MALLFAYFLPLAIFPPLDRPGATSLAYDLAGRMIVGSLAFMLIPLSIGVAILRYRLYDIDVIINRTLVYGTLTLTLALAYFSGVALLQYLLRSFTGQDAQLAIVASTLAVAALFQPLRIRIQNTIDRRFYRQKYDAARTLEDFSARLRNDRDLEQLTAELLSVVRETVQPAHVSLWLKPENLAKGEETD